MHRSAPWAEGTVAVTGPLRIVDQAASVAGSVAASGAASVRPTGAGHRLRLDHAVFRRWPALTLELDGERVARASVTIGAAHRGVEEACASRPWYQGVPLVERIAPRSAPLPATALCRAVERLLELAPPVRAEWLRVAAGETARAVDHLARLAGTCEALGAVAQTAWLETARERAAACLEVLTGARLGYGFVRIGGVRRWPASTMAAWVREQVPDVLAMLHDVERLLGRSRTFGEQLRGVAVLDRETALRFGASGVLLRAAGVPADLRKRAGYSVYSEIDFDVAVGSVGDGYDRFWVCVEEVRQSLRILVQALDRLEALGPGAVRSDDPRLAWPAHRRPFEDPAEMIHHTLGVTEGPRVPPGETYEAIESATGELGFYVVSDGSAIPQRVRCRAPGFFHARLLPGLLAGVRLDAVSATLALLDVTSAECDR